MLPINKRLDNDDHYEGGNVVKYIVTHGTGNRTDTDEGNANYFCTGSRGSSAHYFVDDDSITQVVEDFNGSWHCGDGNGAYGITNMNSIGIEMCCTEYVYSAKTQANTIELIVYLMKKYNVPIDNVVRHYDASRKICPEAFSANNWEGWYDFKNRISLAYNGQSIPQPAPQPSIDSSVLSVQKAMNRLGFIGANGARLSEDGISGTNTQYAVKTFQGIMGLAVDGIAGTNTWRAINEILSKPLDGVPYPHYEYATRYIQYRVGAGIDGVFGNGTAGYVRTWQNRNGLSADGVVGNGTWGRLIG